ncbi:hypothetical protein MACK_003267 [Theileria orientalis]|uniref:Uncharacterized protein n=1 Tax=Theileria orientalis TaxID=68886 RepID=A0A976SIF5_THEOR|nr:hypothetical protein MACK_003267 [Theileria orientalis]
MELVVKLSGHQHHQLEGTHRFTNLIPYSSMLCFKALYWLCLWFFILHGHL